MELSWKKTLQELLPLLFLIGTSVSLGSKEEAKLTIKKCCPKGQELNSSLMCVNVTRDLENNKANNAEDAGEKTSYFQNNPDRIFFPDFNDSSIENGSTVDDFPWFPFASLISSATLKQITDSGSINDLFDDVNFEYGIRPKCNSDERELGCFRPKYSEQFHLLLHPGPGIKLYIFKNFSRQDEGHFEVENRDCGFSKIDPGENNTKGKDSTDLLGKPFFDVRGPQKIPLEDFCLDKGPGDNFLVEYCPCESLPCVRKCCRDSEVYDEAEEKCVPDPRFGFWRPQTENSDLGNYHLLSNRYPSTCEKPLLLKLAQTTNSRGSCGSQQQENGSEFYFLSDGSLQARRYELNIPSQSYCGDHVIHDSKVYSESNFLICPPDYNLISKFGDYGVNGEVYGVFFIIGGFALLVTVAISLYIPEMRAYSFNKAIICHNASLMLGYFIWGPNYLLSRVSYKVCVFMSLGMQYAVFVSLFMMTVMCLDIALFFRGWTSSGEAADGKHKLLRYMFYACGASAIITSITAAMEFAPSLPPHYVRPGFGCSDCGFNPDSNSILIYYYGPVMAIILLILAMYLYTVIQMAKTQKEIAATCNSMFKTIIARRFAIFSKLFLSMGLSWIVEVVSWVIGGRDHYWYFFVSFLRAFFIFVLFVCNRRVLRSLMRKVKRRQEEEEEEEVSHIETVNRKSSEVDPVLEEIRRRERILKKQITQTFRRSGESEF